MTLQQNMSIRYVLKLSTNILEIAAGFVCWDTDVFLMFSLSVHLRFFLALKKSDIPPI